MYVCTCNVCVCSYNVRRILYVHTYIARTHVYCTYARTLYVHIVRVYVQCTCVGMMYVCTCVCTLYVCSYNVRLYVQCTYVHIYIIYTPQSHKYIHGRCKKRFFKYVFFCMRECSIRGCRTRGLITHTLTRTLTLIHSLTHTVTHPHTYRRVDYVNIM